MPALLAHIRSGALRGLAATTASRKVLPDLPTLAQSGLAGYNIASWYGIFAPVGTLARIIALLQAEIARAIKTKTVAARLSDYELIANTPAELAEFLKRDAEVTMRVIAQSGASAS